MIKNQIKKRTLQSLAPLLLAGGPVPLCLQSQAALADTDKVTTNAEVDNSKRNERDNTSNRPTAEEQGKSTADLQLTKNIRHALTQDSTLSTYGQNVKIISRDGNVTLRGPVKSQTEKQRIHEKATTIAGAEHVTNQLSVKQ